MAKARSTRRRAAPDVEGQADPRAPLDGARFLAAARPVLAQLSEDLLARAKDSRAVTAALEARHAREHAARRTADPFPVWQTHLVDQVAAAWLLSCVFARTLEDRGLVAQPRLAGPGAADSQRLFFDLAPSLAERDYLLTVFRELARFPAARDLFDARHNPVWLLTPSAEAAKALLALFRMPSAEAPAFRFGQADTRFLGDLYQDLNEAVQKRYALLQTPRFVESFILDRTLERAIERFGLDETTVLDPTCGSGHFLLGSFDRLFDHRLRKEPGLDPREAARRALDAVYGADINPYAVAIARFRLTLAYLEKAGFTRLAEAPALPLHLVVADSLLHNPQLEQKSFQDLEGQSPEAWAGEAFALEDEAAAREVLHRRYGAVVGNPPYITVKDAVLRERYREMYVSAAGLYSLAAPFAERFFQLACDGGSVGMITANSFMKREFGKKLIEEFLPTVNLNLIVNTSGAYIPGHGTPTVLLFGTAAAPQGQDVRAVLAKRGEPTTPEDGQQGLVWRSIADHWEEVGFENNYVSVARVERANLANHPWSLGGGGAAELKELLEERSGGNLEDQVLSIGFMCITKQDDVFAQPAGVLTRFGVNEGWVAPFIVGETVRDWAVATDTEVLFPYLPSGELKPLQPGSRAHHFLWPYRVALQSRAVFGGQTFVEAGRVWYEYGQIPKDRIRGPAISFPFVATHNHFVLDRGGKVFNRTAPIIKLPETATEDDHLALLAYLNSSTACFWMKQVSHDKGSGTDTGKWQDEPAKIAYEFAGTQLAQLPLPELTADARLKLRTLAKEASELAQRSQGLLRVFDGAADLPEDRERLTSLLERLRQEDRTIEERLVALQEEIDWTCYVAFRLCPPHLAAAAARDCATLGARPFEIALARNGRTEGIDGQSLYPGACGAEFEARVAEIARNAELALLEVPEYKRRWRITPKNLGGAVRTFDHRAREAMWAWLASTLESTVIDLARDCPTGSRTIAGRCPASFAVIADHLDVGGSSSAVARLFAEDAIPFLACLRFTDEGMQKRAAWETTWAQQRAEDVGQRGAAIDPAPKYSSSDYRTTRFWELRGKLDVPKERFISYPGCESDQDGEPVYGWAGWNHLQQAQALAALYQKRKTEEGWEKDRLTPMLAGQLELLPWIKQWHNEPSDEYGGMRLGDFFEGFLDGECRTLGLTRDDLRAWRPAEKKRGKVRKKTRPEATTDTESDGEAGTPAPAEGVPDPGATERSASARKAWETRRKRKAETVGEG